MEEALKAYCKTLEVQGEKVQKRFSHCCRVAQNARLLGTSLGLNAADLELLKAASLLHDIGKLTMQGSLAVPKMDHGQYAIQLLQKDALIRRFIPQIDDELIYFAIRNHNQFTVEETSDQKKRLFAWIVRDADKLDILYRIAILHEKQLNVSGIVSEPVKEAFYHEQKINRTQIQTERDQVLSLLSFVFDLNFVKSLQIIQKEGYLEKLNLDHSFDEYLSILNQYIEKRISNVR